MNWSTLKDIDAWRKTHMAFAEWIDAWRIIPRLLVFAYSFMLWKVIEWYMSIGPELISNCNVDKLGELCISQAPTTQDAILVTTVVGVAAAVFGLYTNTGRKWNGFTHWNVHNKPLKPDDENTSE